MTPFDHFQELGNVLDCFSSNKDTTALDLKLEPAKQLLLRCLNGAPFEKAFFEILRNEQTEFAKLFFGTHQPMYGLSVQHVIARDEDRSLQVVILRQPARLGRYEPKSVILFTDFRSFSLCRTDEGGMVSKPFAVFDCREISEEIAFNGSIWAIVYPKHYAMISRTISYTFPQNAGGALFAGKLATTNHLLTEEKVAYHRLKCLITSSGTSLLSLEALRLKMNSLSRTPTLLSEHKEGINTIRRYSPQRSSIFDFGSPAGKLSRGDIVTTYCANQEEFHREFFIAPSGWEAEEEELQLAVFDILHMLAIRRAKLFRTEFASRVYNVLLPPVLLMENSRTSAGYVVFPCLNLYRTQRRGFRRTLSMTFIACPINVSTSQDDNRNCHASRPAPLEEIYQIKEELLSPVVYPSSLGKSRRYMIGGPILAYLELADRLTVPELLRDLSKGILRRILAKRFGKHRTENLIRDACFPSNMESRIATISLQVEWNSPEGYRHPWERWLGSGEDKVFCNGLFRTLFYSDYLDPYSADASSYALQFKAFNIGDTLGGDMGGMTFFNPQESVKFVLYPKGREKYPDHSMVRWMTWQVYIDSALASLRALIHKFHPIFEGRGDMYSIIETLDEMIQEFVDFYDLDIRDYFYRKEYERIRSLMHLDSDYAQLLSKFASYKEEESLREQRLINKLIFSLTVATVTISIVSTLAQMGGLSKLNYSIIALGLSTVLVWIGYKCFDSSRRIFKRLVDVVRWLTRGAF